MLEHVHFFNVTSDDLNIKDLSQMAQNYHLNENIIDDELNKISHLTGNNLALLEKLFSLASGNSEL